jgi:hypothetical protein
MPPRYEVCFVMWHRHDDVKHYLAEGWEPFAVTQDEDGATPWLRREV